MKIDLQERQEMVTVTKQSETPRVVSERDPMKSECDSAIPGINSTTTDHLDAKCTLPAEVAASSDRPVVISTVSSAREYTDERKHTHEKENSGISPKVMKCPDPDIVMVERVTVGKDAKLNTGQNYCHGDGAGVQCNDTVATPNEHAKSTGATPNEDSEETKEHVRSAGVKPKEPPGVTSRERLELGQLHVQTCSSCGQNLPCHEDDGKIWYTDLLNPDDHIFEHFRNSMNFDLIVDAPKCDFFSENLGFVPEDEEESPVTSTAIDKDTTTDGDLRRGSAISKKKHAGRVFQQVVILFGCCFNVLIGLGFPLSLGALYVDWLETFQSTHAETSIIQSICAGLTLMGGVVVGFLIRRFGVRIVLVAGSILCCIGLVASWFATSNIFLIISIGVVMGSGCSMLFLASNVNVTLAFSKGRVKSFALALLIMSAGIGMMIFPELLQELKKIFGWRGALLIMGGVFLNVSVSSLIVTSPLCIPSHANDDNKPTSPEKKTIKWSRLLNPLYFAYLLCAMVGFGTITATALTTVDFSLSKGLTSEQGILYLFLINTATTVSRLLAGLAVLVPGIRSSHIYCSSYLVGGAALIVLSWTDSYAVITACFGVYGFGSGGMVATYGAGILNAVGEDIFPVTMGIAGVVSGLSFATFGIIIGTLYDLLGSYDLAFRIFGCMSAGASIFFFLVSCIQNRRHHKTAPITLVG